MKYLQELWLGKSKEGVHWEIKGCPEDDCKRRVEAVEYFIAALKEIREYYQGQYEIPIQIKG